MTHRLSRTTALVAIALLACAMLFFVSPGTAHADAFRPLQIIGFRTPSTKRNHACS